MVEIDFTGLGKTIDTVKLPTAAIKDIAAKAQNEEVGGLTVKLPDGEISFDANALSAIQSQASSQITLTLTPAKPADLNNRQKEAVGSAPVFDLTLRSSNGAITDLSGKEFDLLLFFAQNPNRVLTEAQIYDRVWHSDKDFHSSIAKPINRLRQKIEPDQRNPVYIQSIRGVGYQFVPNIVTSCDI